jgi:hypothetical protein
MAGFPQAKGLSRAPVRPSKEKWPPGYGGRSPIALIRCGIPGCDWGHKVAELSDVQLELCYSEFRKHCIRRHDLQEWDTTSARAFGLETWVLTLIKT